MLWASTACTLAPEARDGARDRNCRSLRQATPRGLAILAGTPGLPHAHQQNTSELDRLFFLGSEKGADDLGQYGEGFKAAAICLLRDHGVPEFDTNHAKSLICIEATSRRATTARAIERRARVS